MLLMWKMTKLFWGTGEMVIVDSGLYLLRGLIGMIERGVYDSALVKKFRYRPTGIYGDQMNGKCKNM